MEAEFFFAFIYLVKLGMCTGNKTLRKEISMKTAERCFICFQWTFPCEFIILNALRRLCNCVNIP